MEFKVRTGVSGSSWAGEGPEIITLATKGEFTRHVKEAAAKARENLRAAKANPGSDGTLKDGSVIEVNKDSDGNGTVEITSTVEYLHPDSALFAEWRCYRAEDEDEQGAPECEVGKGCAKCNDGFTSSPDGDRFVRVIEGHAYLCITRYYEPQEND